MQLVGCEKEWLFLEEKLLAHNLISLSITLGCSSDEHTRGKNNSPLTFLPIYLQIIIRPKVQSEEAPSERWPWLAKWDHFLLFHSVQLNGPRTNHYFLVPAVSCQNSRNTWRIILAHNFPPFFRICARFLLEVLTFWGDHNFKKFWEGEFLQQTIPNKFYSFLRNSKASFLFILSLEAKLDLPKPSFVAVKNISQINRFLLWK